MSSKKEETIYISSEEEDDDKEIEEKEDIKSINENKDLVNINSEKKNKKNKKKQRKDINNKFIHITDLCSDFRIIKILHALVDINNKNKLIKFILLVENIHTKEEFKMKATNEHLKIYAPELLCDYYEGRINSIEPIN